MPQSLNAVGEALATLPLERWAELLAVFVGTLIVVLVRRAGKQSAPRDGDGGSGKTEGERLQEIERKLEQILRDRRDQP